MSYFNRLPDPNLIHSNISKIVSKYTTIKYFLLYLYKNKLLFSYIMSFWNSEMIGLKLSGMLPLLHNISAQSKCLRYIGYTATGAGILFQILKRKSKLQVNEKNVALITGCDSGLGWSQKNLSKKFDRKRS